jgi:site-specific DNA-methyltransferase (adenine-specific)
LGDNAVKPYYYNAGITIYHGDCRDILPTLAYDVVVADPPYGVLEPGDLNPRVRDDRGGVHGLVRGRYAGYLDTYENFVADVVPALTMALNGAVRGAVFTGPHIQEQLKATAIGGIYCPAGCGRHQWGFKTFLPVLFYGTAPDLNLGAKPNTLQSSDTAERNGHPCPKPLSWMKWLVVLASSDKEVICDPFMGSGTTLRAAKDLGCSAIGIEIEERYCEMAAKRLQQEVIEF